MSKFREIMKDSVPVCIDIFVQNKILQRQKYRTIKFCFCFANINYKTLNNHAQNI